MSDMVNSPKHYTLGKVECLDAIKAALGPGYKLPAGRDNQIHMAVRAQGQPC